MTEGQDRKTDAKSESGNTDAAEEAAPAGAAPASKRPRRIGWRSQDVLRAAALVIAMYILVKLLWFANALLLTIFMGILFGLAVSSGVDRLERFRIRRGIGAALIVVTFFAILGGFFAMMAPTLRKQSGELRRELPAAIEKAEQWFAKRQSGMMGMFLGGQGGDTKAGDTKAGDTKSGDAKAGDTKSDETKSGDAKGADAKSGAGEDTRARDSADADTASKKEKEKEKKAGDSAAVAAKEGGQEQTGSFRERIESLMSGASTYMFRFLSSTVAVFAGLLLIVFLAIYIGAEPDLYRRGVLHLIPLRSRDRASEVMAAMAKVLRKWLVTQLIAMAVIGGVTTVGLLLFKVKAAFALGFIAGLLEFIPTVGPVLSAIPAVAMAFLDSPQKAGLVAVLYVGIQFLENHILIPLLMKDGMDLPPAITIVAQALMALVFGFIGLLVAVPLTAAAMVAIRMLYVQDVVGEPVASIGRTSSAR